MDQWSDITKKCSYFLVMRRFLVKSITFKFVFLWMVLRALRGKLLRFQFQILHLIKLIENWKHSSVSSVASPLVVAVGTQLQAKHFFSPFSFVLFSARTAQQQCCLGSLRESRCLAGMNAARAGNMCQEDAGDKCGIDSYKASICDQIPWQRANTVHCFHS